MTALSDQAFAIAARLRRMQPVNHDPHWLHLEKADLEREARDLAMKLRDLERGVARETISERRDEG